MLFHFKAVHRFQNKASEFYFTVSCGIGSADTFHLGYITAPAVCLQPFSLSHVRMVEVLELGTAAMVDDLLFCSNFISKHCLCLLVSRTHHLYTCLR